MGALSPAMNASQLNKLAMYREVGVCLAVLASNAAPPALPGLLTVFRTALAELDAWADAQAKPTRGSIDRREQTLTAATELAVAVAGLVSSYAHAHKRPDLAALAHVKRSHFHQIRRSERMVLAQRVHDTAHSLLAELCGYGVTPALLADLQARINLASLAVSIPRTAAADKKAATAQLTAAFAELDALLCHELDPLLVILHLTDPTAHARYRIARQIIHRGGHRRATSEAAHLAASTPAVPSLSAPPLSAPSHPTDATPAASPTANIDQSDIAPAPLPGTVDPQPPLAALPIAATDRSPPPNRHGGSITRKFYAALRHWPTWAQQRRN